MQQLHEITHIAQDNPPYHKQWFQSSNIDLFIWTDSEKVIKAFDLVYDKNKNEKAIIWSMIRGFNHVKIDDGSKRKALKMSPIYLGEDSCDIEYIIKLFQEEAKHLDKGYYKFIRNKLYEYDYTHFDL